MQLTRKLSRKKWPILLLSLALLSPAACIPDKKAQEEQRQEIQGLKTEIIALKEQINALKEQAAKLEAGQQQIINLLANPPAPPTPPAAAAPPAAPEPFTVSQLFKEKERLLGSRVTVKAVPGPVVVHRKTMLLKAPEGSIEVYFGDLPDVKTVNRLTSTTLDQPLSITGLLSPAAGGGASLRIIAEVVEF